MQENKNHIIPFGYGDNLVRVISDETTGEPIWIAKDICEILEYKEVSKTLSKLDDDEKDTKKVRTLGGEQNMMCINESGLYTLILRSNKPEAKKFKKWVTSEVLPTIRKTGGYGNENLQPQINILTENITTLVNGLNNFMQMQMEFNKEILLVLSQNNNSLNTKITTLNKRLDSFDSKIDNIGSVAIKTNIVLKDTYNYVKYQPLSREERTKLQNKIKNRGIILAARHSISKENAIASIYRMLNKAYDLTTYHELEHKDFLSVYDWVDYVELGNFEASPTIIENDLEREFRDSEQSSVRDIYGNRFTGEMK